MTERSSVYLDHSATTPVDPIVAEVVHDAMLHQWGNPSSKYRVGNDAKVAVQTAREQVAGLISAPADALYFTSGGTEADNLAIFGTMEFARQTGNRDHFITTAFEHSAVGRTVDHLRERGFSTTVLPITSAGFIDPDALRDAIHDRTALVSVMHVNNEIGTIQPIAELAAITKDHGALFHTDAVQSYGKVPLSVQDVPVDLVSMSSHKIYGPKGIGALYVRAGVEITPRQVGGGQEQGIRTGTENTPGIVGFGRAAAICAETMDNEAERIGNLRDRFHGWIRDEVGEGVHLNGSVEGRIYLNLNLRFDDVEAESLLLALDLDGIAVSTGSACSSGSTKPSHVLTALGLSEIEAHSSLRMTLGRSNDEDQLRFAAERIGAHVRRLREMAVF